MGSYTDIRVQGVTVSQGNRECEARYEKVAALCRNFQRPIAVLDIGAAEGYFTFRLAEDFDGAFIAVERDLKRRLLELCQQNDSNKVTLLHKRMTLEDLKNLAEVQRFDVVLALNIIHHFSEPFQDVLDTIMSMCSYCFLEHPNPSGGSAASNYDRVCAEPLDLQRYGAVEQGVTSRYRGAEPRSLWQLHNGTQKSIQRRWFQRGQPYKKGQGISIDADFAQTSMSYMHRDESRSWIPGIDLRTFFGLGGAYPTREQLYSEIATLEGAFNDLAPNNVILSGRRLSVIDQDDVRCKIDTPEKLIAQLRARF